MRVLHEIKTLLKYRAVNNYTDGEYIGQRLGDKVLFSLILMSLYWQTGKWSEGDGPASVYNLNALLLAMVRAMLHSPQHPCLLSLASTSLESRRPHSPQRGDTHWRR